MQRKVIAILRLGDIGRVWLRRVDGHGLTADALGELNGNAADLLRLMQIGQGGTQHAMICHVGRARKPQRRPDLITLGLRITPKKIRLGELRNDPMDRRPWKPEVVRHVDYTPRTNREMLDDGERAG